SVAGGPVSYRERVAVRAVLEPVRLVMAYLDLAHQLFSQAGYVEAEHVLGKDINRLVVSIDALVQKCVGTPTGGEGCGCRMSDAGQWIDRGLLSARGADGQWEYEVELQWESPYSRLYLDERITP